jgi:hypothetical protein
MDRIKCKRIIKNVSRLLRAQLAEIPEEEIGREKKLWVRKWLARNIHGSSSLLLKELHAGDRLNTGLV